MLALHIVSLGFVLGVTTIADKEAFMWVWGKKQTLDKKAFHNYHLLVWAGLISLSITGFYMFYPMRFFLLRDLLFDAKLLFVGILFINAILIGRLMQLAFVKPFSELTRKEKTSIILSGAISTFSWICAVGIAVMVF